ncbi:MAG: hypothetical protein HYX67_17305 [Candidatus Melainabacteria bacterium]|nr:hypothetical protein [Candidatus Melainabacteria bacterium]
MTARNTRRRSSPIDNRKKGSMLTMTTLVVGIVLVACMLGFGFYMLLAQQKKGQHQADNLTLALAGSLNKDDKIGQMNNVVARCRELVFVSRQNADAASAERNQILAPLANQLLDESRSSAQFVEAERKNQIEYITKKARESVEHYNLNTHVDSTFTLPWFKTYDPQVQDVYLGYIDKVQSNVINTEVIPELREHDEKEKYFEKGSQLYRGNIDAKLPSPDSDLIFKLSSLPADVDKTVSPPRMTNPEVFVRLAPLFLDEKFTNQRKADQIPSAVEVFAKMDVSMKTGDQKVRIGSTATTNGGQPIP